MPNVHTEIPLLVAFVDLTRFLAQSQRISDTDMANTLDAYYERVAAITEAAGGRVIKFFGDGGLIVFGEDDVDRGVQALLELKEAIDNFMGEQGWDCRLTIKANFGPVVTGPFGAANAKRYDIQGKTVNTAARLDGAGITLSVEAFRKLSPDLRRRFKKHTTSVTYIRNEDQRRYR